MVLPCSHHLFSLPSMERVRIGAPVAEAAAQEAELLGANRVFVVCSGTLNSQTGRSLG